MVKQDFQYCWRNSLTKVATALLFCSSRDRLGSKPLLA